MPRKPAADAIVIASSDSNVLTVDPPTLEVYGDVKIHGAIEASEAKAIEKHKAAPEPDKTGPRIPVAILDFNRDVSLPGAFYGRALECGYRKNQRHWVADYLPKLGMYELTYVPAPGQREASVVTLIPREWARFQPA